MFVFAMVASLSPILAQNRIEPSGPQLDRAVFVGRTAPDVDMRPRITTAGIEVKNQGARNTCSVFAVTFCLEYVFATREGMGKAADFSEEYQNYVKNVACQIRKDGGFFEEIDRGYQAWGCYPRDRVPYRRTYDPHYEVDPSHMKAAKSWKRLKSDFVKVWDKTKGASGPEIDKVSNYLKQGFPVAGGFLWPNRIQFEQVAGLSMMVVPISKHDVSDGHSVALVGFKRSPLFLGGGYFIIRNSWGKRWGEQGYALMPFDYVAKYCNDLLAYHE